SEAQHGGRVGPSCLEDDEGEVQHAGDTELEVEAPRGDHGYTDVDEDRRDVVLGGSAHLVIARSVARRENNPWGRTSRTAISTPKASTSLSSGFQYAAPTSVTIPTTSAPSTAPRGEPIPPSTAAAMITIRNSEPVVAVKVLVSRNRATPPIPASTPDTNQASAMTWRVGMPQALASEALTASPRMALPTRVY